MSDQLWEHEAFLAAAEKVDPSCVVHGTGWTAHDVVAHLVAGGAELARLLGARSQGGPVGPTTSFADREPPFRALPYAQLIELLGGRLLQDALASMAAEDDGRLMFTGWDMSAADLVLHLRSELAMHRWDLVGDDDEGTALLGQTELTTHAVRCLTRFGAIGERASERTRRSGLDELFIRLRTDGESDVLIDITASGTDLRLTDPDGSPAVTMHGADRLLALWGRRPCHTRTSIATVEPLTLHAANRWLYA